MTEVVFYVNIAFYLCKFAVKVMQFYQFNLNASFIR